MTKFAGVALCGPMGAGKTTVANYLEETYGLPQYNFGFYVRETIVHAGLEIDDIFAEEKSPQLRRLLQEVGHGFRQFDPEIWIEKLIEEWEECGAPPLVIGDLRYENEAEAMRKYGVKIVHVDCPGLLEDENEARQHESETNMADWMEYDGLLVADHGDIKSLYDQMDELMQKWGA